MTPSGTPEPKFLRQMRLTKVTQHSAFRNTALIMLLVIIALTAYLTQPDTRPINAHTANGSNTTTKSNASNYTAPKKNGSVPNNGNTSAATSANSAIASNGSATPSGPCDSVLTVSQAKSVLGGSPTAKNGNGTTGQSADITTVTCSYSVEPDIATIIEHKSNTPTGQHENDDRFGSSRPSGVTNVSGYGQAAYWETSTGLNILQDNNWYVVSVSNNGSLNEPTSKQLAQASQI